MATSNGDHILQRPPFWGGLRQLSRGLRGCSPDQRLAVTKPISGISNAPASRRQKLRDALLPWKLADGGARWAQSKLGPCILYLCLGASPDRWLRAWIVPSLGAVVNASPRHPTPSQVLPDLGKNGKLSLYVAASHEVRPARAIFWRAPATFRWAPSECQRHSEC